MIEAINGEEAARLFVESLPRRASGSVVKSSFTSARGAHGAGQTRGIELLAELARQFSEFPYENISKILKAAEAPTLAAAMRLPTEVVSDHIDRHFGGTCFSLTFLFERLLSHFGFDCYKVMAHMNSGLNVHCLIVVREAGVKYMVDPGYALYEVIRLPERGRARSRLPHAAVEVANSERGLPGGPVPAAPFPTYSVWTEDASGRKWRYRFSDSPTTDAEFEAHWLESFAKPTLNNICLTRMTPRGHIYLRKDYFKFTSPTAVEKRRLAGGREHLIEQEFGISAEWVEAAQQVLDARRAAGARNPSRVGPAKAGRPEEGPWLR